MSTRKRKKDKEGKREGVWVQLYCSCGLVLSSELKVTTEIKRNPKDREPIVVGGHLYIQPKGDPPHPNFGAGNYILNLFNLVDIKKGGVRNGDSGVDGCDGLNLACKDGHLFATEVDDSWTPCYVEVNATATKKVEL